VQTSNEQGGAEYANVELLSALQARGTQPVWYALSLLALMPAGVLAGGLVRLRVLGIL